MKAIAALTTSVLGEGDVKRFEPSRGLLPSTESQRPVRLRRSDAKIAVVSGVAFSRACASVVERRGSLRRLYSHVRRSSAAPVTRTIINRPPAGRPPPSALCSRAYPEIRILLILLHQTGPLAVSRQG